MISTSNDALCKLWVPFVGLVSNTTYILYRREKFTKTLFAWIASEGQISSQTSNPEWFMNGNSCTKNFNWQPYQTGSRNRMMTSWSVSRAAGDWIAFSANKQRWKNRQLFFKQFEIMKAYECVLTTIIRSYPVCDLFQYQKSRDACKQTS